jgi:hypothetical protein
LQGSVWKVLPRSIQILLKKEDGDKGFWERLLKDKQLEKTNVKVRRLGSAIILIPRRGTAAIMSLEWGVRYGADCGRAAFVRWTGIVTWTRTRRTRTRASIWGIWRAAW